jgi:hypothetical protein
MKRMEDEVGSERKLGRELWEKVYVVGCLRGRGARQEFLPSEVADCWDDMLRNCATAKERKAREEGVCALTVILLDSQPTR